LAIGQNGQESELAMQFLDQRVLGATILLLWGMLVAIKKITTGSLLRDRPRGGAWLWLTHVFNFFFLLVVNPLAAILLIFPHVEALDPTHLPVESPGLLTALRAAAMLLCAIGYFLLAWALVTLRRNYQVGGCDPRTSDELVTRGPYRFVRHPMYAAVLGISLGLAGLTQSLIYLGVFCSYVLLVGRLIPVEEEGLRRAYGEPYVFYQKRVNRLIPSLY
jgi:protein-S-isoprenylcysteine O-methyltransferase Ste14